LFSLLFRPSWPPEKAAWLTMIAGLAVVKAVETLYELTPRLKWPNDLLLPSRDQWLKFGGMLLEAQMTEERLDASILGIGINVNVRPGQLPRSSYPATSLLQESGQQMERPVLLNEVLAALEGGYEAARLGYPPLKAWQDKLVTLGQAVSIVQVGRRLPLTGIAVDTDNMGRLIVREESGREHVVAAGDVTFQVDNSGE
ncbi:MAG: biotin--[acetyl-CoA-carboxylase] ligase, partial [Chloroflexota bacterium]